MNFASSRAPPRRAGLKEGLWSRCKTVNWNTARHSAERMTLDMTKRFLAGTRLSTSTCATGPSIAPPSRLKPILRIFPASSAIQLNFWAKGSSLGSGSAFFVGSFGWSPLGNSGEKNVM